MLLHEDVAHLCMTNFTVHDVNSPAGCIQRAAIRRYGWSHRTAHPSGNAALAGEQPDDKQHDGDPEDYFENARGCSKDAAKAENCCEDSYNQ